MKTTIFLRQMAWERAKGELKAMLCTFWHGDKGAGGDGFEKLNDEVNTFIKKVEDDGLHE